MKYRQKNEPSSAPRGRKFRLALLALLACSLVSVTAFGAPDLTKLADELAKLRADVETLSTEVETKKEERRMRLRSLASQKADLELQIQREERRIEQLQAQAAEQREKVAARSEASAGLRPAVDASMEEIRGAIHRGLPFKRQERLAEVDKIEQQLDQGLISAEKATSRLWQLVEDELRLARENGLYSQTIVLDSEEMLVDVARVGMVAMYFQTDDGRVGWVDRRGDDWVYVVEESKEGRQQIDQLFDAFQKQIRVGYFRLPGGLPEGDAR